MQVIASPCRTCSFCRNTPSLWRSAGVGARSSSLYTRQLADLIDKFCIDYHFFADDSDLYSCLPTEPESALNALRNVESCCRQIKIWMTKNKLKLIEQKTEVLLYGPSSRRETVLVDCLSVGEASIPFSNVVKTLGVTLDAELSMEQHVSAVVRSCFFPHQISE